MVTVFPGQPERRRAIQACPLRGVTPAEVDVTVPLVGRIPGQQPGSQRDHLPDVGMRAGLQSRLPHPQGGHVLVEVELLDRREPAVRRARPVRGRQQHIVHVGHVPAHDHLGAARTQHARQRVDPDECRGMPQMGDVIGGDTARVHPGPASQRQQRPAHRRGLRRARGNQLSHRQLPPLHLGCCIRLAGEYPGSTQPSLAKGIQAGRDG